VPKSVKTSHESKVTILRNQQVWIDRTIPNNKPDIIIRDNKKGTCMLIDVWRQKFDQERSCEGFKVYRLHNRNSVYVECESKSVLVITGVTGNISKSLRQYLSNIPGKHEIKELQKTATLGTAQMRWKVLM
jgi:hypothetical protein